MRKVALYVFLVPSIAGFLLFFFLPFVGSLYYVFGDGFVSFSRTINNNAFRLAIKNTLMFMAMCVPLNVFIPLIIAMAIKSVCEKNKIFRLAYISPLVVPVASVALFWSVLFVKNGTINLMLSGIGLGKVDFLNSEWAILVFVFIYLWKYLGYIMVLYLAGLSELPRSFSESASMDGANSLKRFFYIIIPGLRSTIFFVLIISILNCFKVFREIYLIAGPYPDESVYMLQHYMNNMFGKGNYALLINAAFILIVFIIAFLAAMFWLNRKKEKKLNM